MKKTNRPLGERERLLEAYHTVLKSGSADVAEKLRAHAEILRLGVRDLDPMAAQDRRDEALAAVLDAVAQMLRPH